MHPYSLASDNMEDVCVVERLWSKPKTFHSMLDARRHNKLRIKRVGWTTNVSLYLSDPFRTLLHMPTHRFVLLFFGTYLAHYGLFALCYLLMSDQCVEGIEKFSHAFFFSVQTSATIGYGGALTPNPDCTILNGLITLQTIVSLLLDYSMLGIVYARFSSPTLRASSILFSQQLAMHAAGDDLVLSLRVVNIRSKQILQPAVHMLIAMEDDHPKVRDDGDQDGNVLRLQGLQVKLSPEAQACLWLGLPATISHVIDDDSPLSHLSIDQMADRKMEVLCLVDGVDAMTSNAMQARHAYQAADIVMDATFYEDLVRRSTDGTIAVNYGCFRHTLAHRAAKRMTQLPLEARGSSLAVPIPRSVSAPQVGSRRTDAAIEDELLDVLAPLRVPGTVWCSAGVAQRGSRDMWREAEPASCSAADSEIPLASMSFSQMKDRFVTGAGGSQRSASALSSPGRHQAELFGGGAGFGLASPRRVSKDSGAADHLRRDMILLCNQILGDASASVAVQERAVVLRSELQAADDELA